MDFKQVKWTNVAEVRDFKGWHGNFTLLKAKPDNSVQLWKREFDGIVCYEVIKPVKWNGILLYPSSEQFGRNGLCINGVHRPWAEYVFEKELFDAEEYLKEARLYKAKKGGFDR